MSHLSHIQVIVLTAEPKVVQTLLLNKAEQNLNHETMAASSAEEQESLVLACKLKFNKNNQILDE